MSEPSESEFRPGSRQRPADQEELTLARGRPWLTWLRGPIGKRIDLLLVRHAGWSPLYWLFGHRMADGGLGGTPILVHSVGRVSGRVRAVVLPAFEQSGSWLICGTLGGGPRDPQWVANLQATPTTEIYLRRRRVPVRARLLAGAERAAINDWLTDRHPSIALYQRRADEHGRTIPVIALTPR
jgi:deazaflavin-dependent oxidoreductase (nitroreductase family)